MKRDIYIFLYALFIFSFIPYSCLAQNEQENVSIDDKVYQWICQQQWPNGLVEETEQGNFVSLYSNALAAIVYTYKGDIPRAEKIFNWFVNNQKEFDASPGGFGQFRDGNGFVAAPHRWMGDNAWLLIALRYYEQETKDMQFQPLAARIEKWLRGLQDKDGGLWGGFESNGDLIGKATEGNIDALNAVSGHDTFHQNIIAFLKQKRWDKENNVFITDWMPYNHAPDLISWGYLALGDEYRFFLSFVDEFKITKESTRGPQMTGISFDLVEKDGIWIEATGQMALAYQVAGRQEKADFYIQEIEKMYVPSQINPEIGGVVYSTNRGTNFGAGKLWAGADEKPHLGTSCWYLMAKWRIDPMAIGRKELIDGTFHPK